MADSAAPVPTEDADGAQGQEACAERAGDLVLLIAASVPIRKVLLGALRAQGLRVLEAESGQQALKVMQTQAIPKSFIIASKLGEQESGIGLVHGLQRIERIRGLPTVLLVSTGTALASIREQGLPDHVVPILQAASTDQLVDRTIRAHVRAVRALTGEVSASDAEGDLAPHDDGLDAMSRALRFVSELSQRVASGKLPGPVLPDVVREVDQVLSREQVEPAEIAECVRAHQSLSMRLMALVNSAFFGRGTKVTTVEEAIKRLGLEKTSSLLRAVAANAFIVGDEPALQRLIRRTLKRAYLVGALAEQLAKHDKGVDASDVYMLGLFHNIGTTFLVYTFALLRSQGQVEEIDEEAIATVARDRAGDLNRLVYKPMKLPPEIELLFGDPNPKPGMADDATLRARVVRQAIWAAERVEIDRRGTLELDDEGEALGLDAAALKRLDQVTAKILGAMDTCYG